MYGSPWAYYEGLILNTVAGELLQMSSTIANIIDKEDDHVTFQQPPPGFPRGDNVAYLNSFALSIIGGASYHITRCMVEGLTPT